MTDFKDIDYEDIELLREYTFRANTKNCSFALSNIFYWNFKCKLMYAVVDDVLVYRCLKDTRAGYSPTCFPEDLEHFLEQLEEDAKRHGAVMHLHNLTEEMTVRLEAKCPGKYQIGFDRDESDYVYEVQGLATLAGSKYHKKKNHLNKFRKTYDFSYEEICYDNIEECRAMKEQWKLARIDDLASIEKEIAIIDKALDHYDEFGFLGGLIRVDGEVKAFTLGESVSRDTFVTHFEKAYDDMPGLYQAINQQFAEKSIHHFTYVNREEDLGIEGLRKAKTSYQPVLMVDKYTARPLMTS